METDSAPSVPLRTCGTCTLCCKVLAIEELQKPAGPWCPKCNVGKGCSIYDERPAECRTFQCLFLFYPDMTEQWRPSKSKIVFATDETSITAFVDPSSPLAWRREPYYSQMKRWAVVAAPSMRQVLVDIAKRTYAILPDADVDLGVLTDDDRVLYAQSQTPSGARLSVMKVKWDDPRIAGQVEGKAFPPNRV